MLHCKMFTFNALMENTYVVYDEKTRTCAIIDPGCYESTEKKQLVHFIQKEKLQVTHLINTHCHIDHVLGNAFIQKTYQVQLAIHLLEKNMLDNVQNYAGNYAIYAYEPTTAAIFLSEEDSVTIGKHMFKILHVPGHSPGHIALYNAEHQMCLAGDVLFQHSIGRTDLPGGDYDTLIQSIQKKMFLLPDDTTIYPGHGPTTTIAAEKQSNPFCSIQ